MEDAGVYRNPDNLSQKIVDVAAGESHTLLLTGNTSTLFFVYLKRNEHRLWKLNSHTAYLLSIYLYCN